MKPIIALVSLASGNLVTAGALGPQEKVRDHIHNSFLSSLPLPDSLGCRYLTNVELESLVSR